MWGSKNRKMESRIVVAKRQRETPMKIEQRKVPGPEWEPEVKQQPSWLAQFT